MKVTLEALLSMPRKWKKIAAIAFDVGICVLSVWLAFYLRLGTNSGFFTQKFYLRAFSVNFNPSVCNAGFLQCHFSLQRDSRISFIAKGFDLYGVVLLFSF